jgi:predicted nucleic acid-binding protein
MRRYLLDTAPLSALLQARPRAVELIRPWMLRHEANSSVLAYAEVSEYITGFDDFQRRQEALRILLREVAPLFLTFSILERYGQIRRRLRPPYGPGLIGDIDTLIAATALERGLSLVTVDEDFRRVPGLRVIMLSRDELRQR